MAITSQEFVDQLAEKLQTIGTLRAVGETWISIDGAIPAGGIPFCGQEVNRTLWADLFEWATAKGKMKTDAEWQAHADANGGNCPFYSDGDGSTTFRMPRVMAYLKGAGTIEEAGGYTAEGLPNITGGTGYNIGTEGVQTPLSGAFYEGAAEKTLVGGGRSTNGHIMFDAPKSSPIFGGSEHVTPETYGVLIGVYAVGIATNLGSADVSDVMSAVAAAEESVANVKAVLDANLTSIAKLQSFFNGNVEKTLLAGGTEKADWIGMGNITLADSWKNYDALLGFATNDSNTGHVTSSIIFRWQLEALIEIAKTSGKAYFMPFATVAGNYYSFSPTTTTEIAFMSSAENSGIQAIYGLKLKGTGVTNAKAVDVSDVQARLAGMLTDDNHLVLPSGLEVW